MNIIKKVWMIFCTFIIFIISHCTVSLSNQEPQTISDRGEYIEYYNEFDNILEVENKETTEYTDIKKECSLDNDCDSILLYAVFRMVKCVDYQCKYVRCPQDKSCEPCRDGYCERCTPTCVQNADCPGGLVCKSMESDKRCTGCFPP